MEEALERGPGPVDQWGAHSTGARGRAPKRGSWRRRHFSLGNLFFAPGGRVSHEQISQLPESPFSSLPAVAVTPPPRSSAAGDGRRRIRVPSAVLLYLIRSRDADESHQGSTVRSRCKRHSDSAQHEL